MRLNLQDKYTTNDSVHFDDDFNFDYYTNRMICVEDRIERFRSYKNRSRYSVCSECGFPLKTVDKSRGESICGHCGLVIDKHVGFADPKYISNWNNAPLRLDDGCLRRDEKKIIAKLRNKPYHTDMSEWRRRQYYFFAQTVARHYKMLPGLEFLLCRLVLDYNLKKFHPQLSYEKIVLGVAVEILRRNGRPIPYQDKFVQEVGLKKSHLDVIRRNLERLSVFK